MRVGDHHNMAGGQTCMSAIGQIAPTQHPQRVLIVDDNRDAADMLGEFLTVMGHDVRVVYDGRDALRALPQFPAQVVLLDIGLPEIDGWEVARQMREVAPRLILLIIAVTGYGAEKDRQRSRGAGIDHHLVKPADLRTLEALMQRPANS